jgi:hypothetical protein
VRWMTWQAISFRPYILEFAITLPNVDDAEGLGEVSAWMQRLLAMPNRPLMIPVSFPMWCGLCEAGSSNRSLFIFASARPFEK